MARLDGASQVPDGLAPVPVPARRPSGRVALGVVAIALVAGPAGVASAQTKPDGEMRWALCVTLAFMAFYGTLATGAGWIAPKTYTASSSGEGGPSGANHRLKISVSSGLL